MAEPGRISKGEVEKISYRYKSASKSGYTTTSVNIRKNRTLRETLRQLDRIKSANPQAYVDDEHNAYSTALRTFSALGLTGRGERPANARIVRRYSLRKNNR